MSAYIDRLAAEVIASAEPIVTARLVEALRYARPAPDESPLAARWRRDETVRCYLAATLAHARLSDRLLVPAEALRIAARVAERCTEAAVQLGAIA